VAPVIIAVWPENAPIEFRSELIVANLTCHSRLSHFSPRNLTQKIGGGALSTIEHDTSRSESPLTLEHQVIGRAGARALNDLDGRRGLRVNGPEQGPSTCPFHCQFHDKTS
jgi:hypothetical protein